MEEAVADGVLNVDVVVWSDPQEAPAREVSRLGFFLQLAGQNAPAESRASPPPPRPGLPGQGQLEDKDPTAWHLLGPPVSSLWPPRALFCPIHPPPISGLFGFCKAKVGGLPFLSPQRSPEALKAQAQRELPCRVLLTAHGGRHQLRVLHQYGQLTVALPQQAAVIDVGRTFGRKGREANPGRAWVSLPSTTPRKPPHSPMMTRRSSAMSILLWM